MNAAASAYSKVIKKTGNNLYEPSIEYSYFPNGNIAKIIYFKYGDFQVIHREDGPAVNLYYGDGKISNEKYIINGELHREDGPAIIHYDYNYGFIKEEFYYKNGKCHKEDGPAEIYYKKSKKLARKPHYYYNGKWLQEINSNKELKQYIKTLILK